jgi:hypothetical protein
LEQSPSTSLSFPQNLKSLDLSITVGSSLVPFVSLSSVCLPNVEFLYY